jgi:hypothetical protein
MNWHDKTPSSNPALRRLRDFYNSLPDGRAATNWFNSLSKATKEALWEEWRRYEVKRSWSSLG